VEPVVKRFAVTRGLPVDRRDGNHVSKKCEERRDSVMKFNRKLAFTEAHYCRTAKSVRMYLSSSLSINKIYSIYKEVHSGTKGKIRILS
jgi:hypothetical protein